ncbi:MAG: polysaccharide biosynthesis C-terminal domain-containing protein [Acidobacteria bacterium]|nr:polysaccharide biosynthesis C-terminal domain-containing protein [Acidobacteriota bacterium]
MRPVSSHPRRNAAAEADDATRGSAIKLTAEVLTRLITLGTTLLIIRELGVARWDPFSRMWFIAPLIAEGAEFGLQATATRALVAGTLSLRALARARGVLSVLVGGVVLAVAATPLAAHVEGPSRSWLDLGVLALLALYFALSGWGEFLGVALRCRGARVEEGLVLFVLRAGGLVLAAVALKVGAGFAGLGGALALSTVPALAVGAWLLRRRPAPVPGANAPVGRVLRVAAPLALYAGLLLLSPRVEGLVLSWTHIGVETGLFLAALNLFWPLSLVPQAVASGAMPALTREAQAGAGQVRRRTAATLALFAAPAAVGLFIVAPALVPFILDAGFAPAAVWLRILSLALVPMFLNGLLSWALIAAERASLLPRLVALRIAVAFLLALVLVPRFGPTGAAVGFVTAEGLLLLLGARAARAAGFGVPVVQPVAVALLATAPMAFAVWGVRESLPLALTVGVVTYAATLAAAWQLLPGPTALFLGRGTRGEEGAP